MFRKLLLITAALMLMVTSVSAVTLNLDKSGDTVDFTGTAADNTSRVEIRFDGDYWNTVDGTSDWSYSKTFRESGSHVVEVRSIVNSTVHDTKYQTFTLDFDEKSSTSVEDLSWYISVSNVEFATIQETGVREVKKGKDVKVSFDISNEHDSERKLRYTLTRGSWEKEGSLIIDDSDSEEVSHWIAGSQLSSGTNRFEVTVDDYSTKSTVADKTATVTVISETEKSSTDSESQIPDWFKAVAKENNFTLPGDEEDKVNRKVIDKLENLNESIQEQQDTVEENSDTIEKLRERLNDDESESSEGLKIAGYPAWMVGLVAAAGILAYIRRDWILAKFGKSDEPSDKEIEEAMQDEQPPGPEK
jgi:hypothetical protein